MASSTETTLVPGEPDEWREFAVEDYDPDAAPGSDEDTFGELLAEYNDENRFGVILTADAIEDVHPDMVKRLAGGPIPTILRRAGRAEGKAGEKKEKKKDKPKDKKKDK